MDQDKVVPQPTDTMTPTSPQSIIVRKNNNTPLISAIIFLALVIGAAAIYLGMQKKNENSVVPPPAVVVTPTKTIETPITAVPTSPVKFQTYTSTKLKDNSESAYTISYPEDWIKDTKRDAIADTLTLTKNGGIIKIYQAPMGGSQCVFTGTMPEGPASDYTKTKFTDVLADGNTLRRVEVTSKEAGVSDYLFCSNSKSSSTTFGSPTLFGAITYSIVSNDPKAISQMDKIISSLKAVQ